MAKKKQDILKTDLRLPKMDSATGRGLVTTGQAMVATASALSIGLWTVINGVEGCPEAILRYVQENFTMIVVTLGGSTGLASFLWNVFARKDVKNY